MFSIVLPVVVKEIVGHVKSKATGAILMSEYIIRFELVHSRGQHHQLNGCAANRGKWASSKRRGEPQVYQLNG